MKASTRNFIKGTFHKIRGSAKTALGRLAFPGRVERVGGLLQVAFGKTQRIFGR